MTETTTNGDDTVAGQAGGTAPPGEGRRLPPPGLAAIALYLLVLASVVIVGVASGRHYPSIYLVFSALFIAASAGLFLLLRWAWALALSAVFLLAVYYLWMATAGHKPGGLVEGLLNLVFFLYLVRTEVREKLR